MVEFTLIISQQVAEKNLEHLREDPLFGHTVRQTITWPVVPRVGEQVGYHYMMKPAIVESVLHNFLKSKVTVHISVAPQDFKSLFTDLLNIEGWQEFDQRGRVHSKV